MVSFKNALKGCLRFQKFLKEFKIPNISLTVYVMAFMLVCRKIVTYYWSPWGQSRGRREKGLIPKSVYKSIYVEFIRRPSDGGRFITWR